MSNLYIRYPEIPTSGQKTMAESQSVVIASNQSQVPIKTYNIVDFLDNIVINSVTTNIPGSASTPLEAVASLAADVVRVQIVSNAGSAFIGVYSGAAGSETLRICCYLSSLNSNMIDCSFPAGTRISIRRIDITNALTSGYITMNFFG